MPPPPSRPLLVRLLTVVVVVLGSWSMTPTASAAGPVDRAAVDGWVTDYLRAEGLPAAAVAVVHDGQLVVETGRSTDGSEVTASTPMAIGSVSKVFTAFAVLQLVERGEVDLDAPVRDRLPEFVLDDPRAAAITVRQLLDHTAGLPNPLIIPPADGPRERVAQLRTVARIGGPGQTYAYSNLGYQTAARLVEVVSGLDFASYLDRYVFGPAGMDQTRSVPTTAGEPGVDDGHVTAYGRAWSLPEMTAMNTGSGSIVSTAHDLGLWLALQQRGGVAADGTRLLSEELAAASRTPAPGRSYALGWQATTTSTPARIGHDGSLTRYSSRVELVPGSGWGVAVLLNSYTPVTKHPFEIAAGVVDLTEGRTPSSGPPSATVVDAVLGLLTVGAVVLGVRGWRSAPRWVGRRAAWPRWRFGVRLLPQLIAPLLAVGVFAVLPSLQGNSATALDAFGLFPALMVLLVVTAVVGLALSLRRVAVRRRRR